MRNEIERKFFVQTMPDLSHVEPLRYERYFLKREDGVEVRISQINDKYVHEHKREISNLERTRESKEISKEEFDSLKTMVTDSIIRDRYNISKVPKISILIYHGKFEGLVRAEVEFDTKDEAESFISLPWMGKEITDLPIGRDSRLIDLSAREFRELLEKSSNFVPDSQLDNLNNLWFYTTPLQGDANGKCNGRIGFSNLSSPGCSDSTAHEVARA